MPPMPVRQLLMMMMTLMNTPMLMMMLRGWPAGFRHAAAVALMALACHAAAMIDTPLLFHASPRHFFTPMKARRVCISPAARRFAEFDCRAAAAMPCRRCRVDAAALERAARRFSSTPPRAPYLPRWPFYGSRKPRLMGHARFAATPRAPVYCWLRHAAADGVSRPYADYARIPDVTATPRYFFTFRRQISPSFFRRCRRCTMPPAAPHAAAASRRRIAALDAEYFILFSIRHYYATCCRCRRRRIFSEAMPRRWR